MNTVYSYLSNNAEMKSVAGQCVKQCFASKMPWLASGSRWNTSKYRCAINMFCKELDAHCKAFGLVFDEPAPRAARKVVVKTAVIEVSAPQALFDKLEF